MEHPQEHPRRLGGGAARLDGRPPDEPIQLGLGELQAGDLRPTGKVHAQPPAGDAEHPEPADARSILPPMPRLELAEEPLGRGVLAAGQRRLDEHQRRAPLDPQHRPQGAAEPVAGRQRAPAADDRQQMRVRPVPGRLLELLRRLGEVDAGRQARHRGLAEPQPVPRQEIGLGALALARQTLEEDDPPRPVAVQPGQRVQRLAQLAQDRVELQDDAVDRDAERRRQPRVAAASLGVLDARHR